jgi:hypothetical protein
MRTMAIGVLALAGLAMAAPAQAEDMYFGVPGAGVEFHAGPRHHYRDLDRDREFRIHRRETTGFDRHYGDRCRTTIIRRDDGRTVRERRCWD